MKTIVEKSPIPQSRTFVSNRLIASFFDPNWHFHREYQLFIVLKGSGTRFIGDHVDSFFPGDLVFTGPNLPHLWRSDPEYFEEKNPDNTDGIVVYFNREILGDYLLQKTELYSIKQLLTLSHRGLHFPKKISQQVLRKMIQLSQSPNFNGYLILLDILNELSKTKDYTLLSSPHYTNNLRLEDTDRMNKVQAFVFKNFRSQISLEAVAQIANMTPTSFSRYFTKHANKTFSNFLLEIRIGYARKLLIETDQNVNQIAYLSGFQTLSNFNYQFKKLTNMSPSCFRETFHSFGGLG
ncbi:AraC family transcriptional regulator [Membranihabitans marinus]|uniref:AraC family transcriptional regulator n=1 Tax=Membranihabitans marinus TaxID=1227546 RepID=UPI001F1EFC91|nr:AraC family transcriptional regulator [Membranihabitans marinus]